MTKKRKSTPADKTPNLLDIVQRGATIRRHRMFSDLRTILAPAAVVAVLAAAVYLAVMLVAQRGDWFNIIVAMVGIAAVPAFSGLLLVAMRTNKFPVTSGAIVGLVIFAFAVSVLSATRLPISYLALFLCAPILVIGVSYLNTRLQRTRRTHVAILDFPDVDRVLAMIGTEIPVLRPDAPNMVAFDRILIDPVTHHSAQWGPVLARLYMIGIEILPWSAFAEGLLGRVQIDDFDIGHLSYTSTQIYYSKVKRIIDIATVVILSPFALVLSGLIWLYIRIIDGTPSIFIQERRGYGGQTFRLYKFRTMRRGTSAGATQTNDDRILPGCTILRQLHLDELPQLLNILRGDMSFIGPRPVSVEIAEALEASVPQYVNRQLVLPGLTGWAQVAQGYASNADEEIDKLSYDLYYIKHISFDLDLVILVRTIRAVLLRTGAK